MITHRVGFCKKETPLHALNFVSDYQAIRLYTYSLGTLTIKKEVGDPFLWFAGGIKFGGLFNQHK